MTKKAQAFSLKRLGQEFNLPPAELAQVTHVIQAGLDRFRREHRHSDFWSDAELLQRPYVLGYVAVEAARDAALLHTVRLSIVSHTLSVIDPVVDNGIPFGLPVLLSFLAAVNALTLPVFRVVMQVNHLERDWYAEWRRDEIFILLDWLLATSGAPDDERLWWLFYLLQRCDKPDTGKALSSYILAHPALSPDLKQRLCESLLAERPALPSPPHWRAFQALLSGDRAAYEQARAELPPDEISPFIPAAETFDETAPIDLPGLRDPGLGFPSFNFLRSLLVGDFALTPAYLKRQALVGLAALGEDPLTLCQIYLGATDYYGDSINLGVAEVVRTYRSALPDPAVHDLIERGLHIGSVPVRKAFYQMGLDFFGGEYLVRAQADNANSIRQWANKVAAGGEAEAAPKKRGRKPKAAP